MAMESKKIRGPKYSGHENELLLVCIEQYRNVIECKRTDSSSARAKDDAWQSVAHLFNSLPDVSKRTAKQLRLWWDNQKKRTRSRLADHKVELLKTGGGPSVPKADEWDEKVSAISASMFQPLYNDFDCDAVYDQSVTAADSLQRQQPSSSSLSARDVGQPSIIEIPSIASVRDVTQPSIIEISSVTSLRNAGHPSDVQTPSITSLHNVGQQSDVQIPLSLSQHLTTVLANSRYSISSAKKSVDQIPMSIGTNVGQQSTIVSVAQQSSSTLSTQSVGQVPMSIGQQLTRVTAISEHPMSSSSDASGRNWAARRRPYLQQKPQQSAKCASIKASEKIVEVSDVRLELISMQLAIEKERKRNENEEHKVKLAILLDEQRFKMEEHELKVELLKAQIRQYSNEQ